ncbi:MAG: ribulose-phosphate 3-epimerase [Candidatus Saccharimonadales bacterium]
MATICPTITAFDTSGFKTQMNTLRPFAKRLHIDLMDGVFAPTVSPGLTDIWWPEGVTADLHLMYQKPMEQLSALIKLRPNLVIIHNEADVHHMHFAAELHKENIEVGLALLSETPVEYAYQIMHSFDQVLVFSGDLGKHGGVADLDLLDKVHKIRSHHPDVDIAWDGGINLDNISQLVDAGVNILNVGGYIHNADNPADAYAKIQKIAVQ